MTYWLDLFTGTTWQEFLEAGGEVTGFREHNWHRARLIKPGDVFLCYLVGVKRWVGLLEVTGDRYRDDTRIWDDEAFPVRFPVRPLVTLPPEHGVPMDELQGKLTFFQPDAPDYNHWSGMVRSSPTRYADEDGEAIATAIRAAAASPTARPVDEKLLKRSPNLYKLKSKQGDEEVETVVSVPGTEDESAEPTTASPEPFSHTEIQWRLLDLGARMGLDVWAPKADRGRSWSGGRISDVPRLIEALPGQFNDATNAIIANIDVLWLRRNAIVAAFEVEHTTSIYSGLLRMCDLITMQPNIDIKLYLVGPDERYEKFRREVPRPTFAYRPKPLHTICRFLPYSKLCERLKQVKVVLHRLPPEFLDDIAEFYDPAEEVEA